MSEDKFLRKEVGDGMIETEGLDMLEYPRDLEAWVERGISDSKDAVAFCVWAICGEGLQFAPFATEVQKYSLKNVGYDKYDVVNQLWNDSRAALRAEGALIDEVNTRLFAAMRGGYEPMLTVQVFDDEFFEDDHAMNGFYNHVLQEVVQQTLHVWAKNGHPAVRVEGEDERAMQIGLNVEMMAEMEPDFMAVLAYVDNLTTDGDNPFVMGKKVVTESGEDVPEDVAHAAYEEIMEKVNAHIEDNVATYNNMVDEGEYMGVDIDGDDNDDDPFGGEEE